MMGRPSRGAVRGRSNLGLGVRVQRENLGGAELAVAIDVVLLDKSVDGRAVVPRREHLSLSHVPVGVGVVVGHKLLQPVLAHAVGPLLGVDDAVVVEVVVRHPLVDPRRRHRAVGLLLHVDELRELLLRHHAVGVGVVPVVEGGAA